MLKSKRPKSSLYPTDKDSDVVSLVIRLLERVSPSAIFRRIRAIVVDSIYGVLTARLWPHVLKESVERIPTLAYLDPPAAVVFERFVSRVVATFPHMHPRHLFRRVRHAVSRLAFGNSCVVLAAASARLSVSQIANEGNALCAANTSTKNLCIPAISEAWGDSHPVSKGLADWNTFSLHAIFLYWIHIQYSENRLYVAHGAD